MINKLFAYLFGKNFLKSSISKDLVQKLVAVILAVVLWSFVGGEDQIEKIVMVPVEIINLPRDLVISNQFKKEIEVTVSGPRSIILDMSNRAVTRQVDLSSATPGTMVIENDNDHIPVPHNIEVQRVQPPSIILSLDKLIQKKFPVDPQIVGEVPDGYTLVDLKLKPDVITITGPLTILSQYDDFLTKTINLDGIKKSVKLQIPLELDQDIVGLIGETSVTAEIDVKLNTETKTFDKVPVRAVIDGLVKAVIPPYAKVTLKIPQKLMEEQSDVRKTFSLTALKEEGLPGLQVRIIPKPGLEWPLEVVDISPQVVFPADDISSMKSGGAGGKVSKTKAVATEPTNVADVRKMYIASPEEKTGATDVPHLTTDKSKKKMQ